MLTFKEMPDAEAEVKLLLNDLVPEAIAENIAVRSGEDSDGDPSLFVQILRREWPTALDARHAETLVDRFRTWLIREKSEERFPYFEMVTRAEKHERELGDGD